MSAASTKVTYPRVELSGAAETVAITGPAGSREPFAGRTPVEVVREGYARYARRDLAGVFALLSPDVEFTQAAELPWGGRFRGLGGAKEFFSRLHEHTEGAPEPLLYVPAGNDVAVVGRVRGRVRATGREFNLVIVQIWTVREGRITRCAAFVDTPAMQEALGPG